MNDINCCQKQLKTYAPQLGCCLCWYCRNCGLHGCDMNTYANNRPPWRMDKKKKRGVESEFVLMRTGEKTRLRFDKPNNIYASSEHPDVKGRYKVHMVEIDNDFQWVCDIGPIEKPVVTDMVIDNQNVTLIVTK